MGHANLYDVLVAWAPTVGFIVTALIAYWGKNKIATLETKVDNTHLAVKAVEDATNGMKDQLVETTRQAALAAGIAQGKALEKARLDAEALSAVRPGSKD